MKSASARHRGNGIFMKVVFAAAGLAFLRLQLGA